ncbi:MAG: outer membrane beta-barrel protein [Acidobacteriota bacterium]
MMKRMWLQTLWCSMVLAGAAAILTPATAEAQITRVSSSSSEHRQAIGVTVGGFFVKPEDSRVNGDVLFADLDSLLFNVKDFNGGTITGEWLVGISNYLEVGVGAGFYQRSVPSIYRSQVNVDGSEIEQALKLRIVPVTATVRFLPIGHGSVEPYVGVGIGAFNWRYSETGEFVDDRDNSIFRGNYVAKGTAIGPVVVAGIRAPFADAFDIGGEVRYQKADGDTKPDTSQLLGDRIDLGGWNASLTFHVRF